MSRRGDINGILEPLEHCDDPTQRELLISGLFGNKNSLSSIITSPEQFIHLALSIGSDYQNQLISALRTRKDLFRAAITSKDDLNALTDILSPENRESLQEQYGRIYPERQLVCPPKINPDLSACKTDTCIMSDFLEWVLSQTKLDEHTKTDILRVVTCFKFIKANEAFIKYAIAHQKDPAIYTFPNRHRKYGSDIDKGVLRDFNWTSFHIGHYQETDSEKAWTDFSESIDQFEQAILLVTEKGKRMEFAKKLRYDKSSGCLEARTHDALEFAAALNDVEVIYFDDAINDCVNTQGYSTVSDIINYFRKKDLLGKKAIQRTTAEGSDQRSDQDIEITEDFIKNYLKDVLDITEENAAVDGVAITDPLIPSTINAEQRLANTADPLPTLNLNKKEWLLHAARSQPSEDLETLLNNSSADAINTALVETSGLDGTALHVAARYQSGKSFKKLLEIASVEAIDTALVESIRFIGTTAFCVAAQYQPEAFEDLLNKASAKAIDKALVERHSFVIDKRTALWVVARYQSEAALEILVKKASAEALDKALTRISREHGTAVNAAARYQSKEGFEILLSNASEWAINEALINKESGLEGVFTLTLLHQPLSTVLWLLEKIYPQTCQILITQLLQSPRLQETDLVELSFLGKKLGIQERIACALNSFYPFSYGISFFKDYPPFVEEWRTLLSNGKFDLSLENIEKCLSEMDKTPLAQKFKNTIRALLAGHFQHKKEDGIFFYSLSEHHQGMDQEPFFFTAQGTRIEFSDEKMAEILKKEGYATPLDYLRLRRECSLAEIQETLNRLSQHQMLYKSLEDTENVEYPVLSELTDLVNEHRAFVKVIDPKNWDDFKKQLSDYNYRPQLRLEKVLLESLDDYYKFVHLTREIIPYKEKRREKKNYTHTKKTSVTLLTKFQTPVFGHHDSKRLLVGLMFDRTDCVIKAMLKHDRGTYAHEWIDSKNQIKKYKERMFLLNFTNFNQFVAAIEGQPELNEVLAKVSREAIRAVFISHNTPNNMRVAQQYQTELKKELGINVPIVFYDFSNTHRIWLARAVEDDPIQEKIAKTKLQKLKQDIEDKSQQEGWNVGLFAEIPKGILEILRLIEEAEQEVGIWTSTERKIAQLLEKKTSSTIQWLRGRSSDTVEFYKALEQHCLGV